MPRFTMRPSVLALVLSAAAACSHQPETAEPAWGVEPPPYPGTAPDSGQPAPTHSGEAPAQPPASAGGPSDAPLEKRYAGFRPEQTTRGKATYYSDSLAGRPTASGEKYQPEAFTAAHRTLPFGTIVRVVREDGGQAVVVRITDRGPFGEAKRIIDVSRAAAERLDMLRDGVIPVRVEVLEVPDKR